MLLVSFTRILHVLHTKLYLHRACVTISFKPSSRGPKAALASAIDGPQLPTNRLSSLSLTLNKFDA